MPATTPEMTNPAPDAVETRPQAEDSKLHRAPIARLLGKMAKMHGEYVDYQMEAGIWRKLAL